jgi:uncharacterized membrane protein HdeD (DUF308 family)
MYMEQNISLRLGIIMIEFYFPTSTGEWLAFSSAIITIIFGLMLLITPHLSLRILRLQTFADVPSAVSESRATMAGFYLGVGITCILLAQPLLYLALGASWIITSLGRIISMVLDKGNTKYNWISWPIEAGLGILPTLYAWGYL